MQKKHIIIATLISVVSCVVAIPKVFAQTSIGLSVSPPIVRIAAQPGKTVTLAFTLSNTQDQDMEVTPRVVDFTADDETGAQVLLDTTSTEVSLANTDKFINKPFILPAQSKDQVVLQLQFPEKDTEQDYYQTLLLKFSPINMQESTTTSTQAIGYIGANMLISVSKTGEDKGYIQVHSLDSPKIIDSFGSIPVTVKAQNIGTTFTTMNGTIELLSPFGTNISTQTILPEDILAGNIRVIHASKLDPEDNKNRVPTDVTFKAPIFIGPYTIQVMLHAPNQEPVRYTRTVWAIPFSPLIIIIFITLTLILIRKYREPYIKE